MPFGIIYVSLRHVGSVFVPLWCPCEAPMILRPLLLTTLFSASLVAAERPNVVVILTDDQGYGDVTCYNPEAKVSTPNMDRLAVQGVRMLNAYTPASVCSPTRYGLLTGRYPWRTWHKEGVMYRGDPSLIRPGRMTLGTLHQELGYATAAVGKWHLGFDWAPTEGDPGDWNHGQQMRQGGAKRLDGRIDFSQPLRVGPNQLGFDEFFGTEHQGIDHVVVRNAHRVDGLRTLPENHDDLFVDHAERFVREHRQLQPERPFFLYLALGAPHHGNDVPARWKGKSGDGIRGDRIQWADENVGRVLALLDDLGVADNTIVVFTSDNGPTHHKIIPGRNPEHRPNGPWRGFKTDAWDGGFRVPFIVRWPGKIAPGTMADQVVCLTDVLATLADIQGVALPRWAAEDSYSMRAALLGGKAPVRDHVLLQSYTGILSLIEGKWKLILGTEGSGGHQGITHGWMPNQTGWDRIKTITVGQLYDIEADPYETNNLFVQQPAVVARLRDRLESLVLEDRSPRAQ